MEVDLSEFIRLAELQERQMTIIRSVDNDQRTRMEDMMNLLERVITLKKMAKPVEKMVIEQSEEMFDSDPMNLAEDNPELRLET